MSLKIGISEKSARKLKAIHKAIKMKSGFTIVSILPIHIYDTDRDSKYYFADNLLIDCLYFDAFSLHYGLLKLLLKPMPFTYRCGKLGNISTSYYFKLQHNKLMVFKVEMYENSNLLYNIKVNRDHGIYVFKWIYLVVQGCPNVVPAFLNNFNHIRFRRHNTIKHIFIFY